MSTRRLTMAQALLAYLAEQRVERDGIEQRFFAGCFGIFGHGNVAGVGQALQQEPRPLRYVPWRNEQAMVHAAVGYARMKNRLGAYVCTTSIGPGATNLVTGAALATINRLPVLLLPGDIFARRAVAPVLQQLEDERSQDISVNDCLRPVSRYWDRINRPDQLLSALPEVMRTLTSPANTGAVTLALPQDVQAEAYDYPVGFFAPRVWSVPRARPDRAAIARAVRAIKRCKRPLIVAGGGVIYSEATAALRAFVDATRVPVCVSQAGKGALSDEAPRCLGAVGATGTRAANVIAQKADLIIGVGTRYSDFTTASKTAFGAARAFVNINVAEFDAGKHGAIALCGDAAVTLEELCAELVEVAYHTSDDYDAEVVGAAEAWRTERDRFMAPRGDVKTARLPSQAEIIGVLARFAAPTDVIVNAAGSGPGDLHKLWPARDPKSYHIEYGYSCMGYEIPGGLGAKLAAPEREVYVLIGDGSYLMLSSDLVTAVQEGVKLTVILVDNHGYSSIGGLSSSLGSGGFGTQLRAAADEPLVLDFVKNAESLGARALRADTLAQLEEALAAAKAGSRTTVIVVESDGQVRVPGFESWWDVPVAEVSEMPEVQSARRDYEAQLPRERLFHAEGSLYGSQVDEN
ncbi:MAG: 3D-(3,5/4)-trihydroxycyclohexane-1,2-dione acylhydrolase (decyclizing) [Myxococcales bacterium]|nr:3D-(3,5/4)-trihydroxycyclohexane-1,2-dione acylhydrolase (decyclizing) [Myxococcales bacterium]